MSKLICEGLGKRYKKTEVFQKLNLELESGRIYGLIGRNGAGKTTLLSILSAQNPATEGKVTLDGQPIWENEEALKRICFSRELNVGSNASLGAMKIKEYLRIASVYLPNWDQEMAEKLTNLFQLDVKKRLNKLSKGMTSMVTIIVALASKAEFTFLDEPVAGLDVVAREQFYRLLLDEFTDTGRTFVISSHIIEEAADLFEETILLDKGRILVKENTQDFLEQCVYVTGKAEDVERAVCGLETHHMESFGRSRGVMVRLYPGQRIQGENLTVQPMSLQKVFVALCGEEAE
jgi:ABC-2 type transport system ATP-binding protein